MSNLRDTLRTLASAEEFFDVLDVAFDPRILSVNRLHILKRFHDYIEFETFSESPSVTTTEDDEATEHARYQSCLKRAYADFVASTAQQERVFAVFRQARRAGRAFIPLSDLTMGGR